MCFLEHQYVTLTNLYTYGFLNSRLALEQGALCLMQIVTFITLLKLPKAAFGEKRMAVLALLSVGVNVFAADVSSKVSENTSVIAQVQSLDRFQAEQERMKKLIEGKPKAYEDKVMDPSTLPALSAADDAPPDESQMGFRSYLVESRYGLSESSVTGFNPLRASEFGLRTEYRQETLNYGDMVIQADVRHRGGELDTNFGQLSYATRATNERLTIRNLGFPITPHTFADTSLGDIYSEVTDAFSRSYRLSLGSSTVRGLGTRVFDRDFDLRVGVGQRGNLNGGPYPGFEASRGTLAWLGYTQRFAGNLYAGVQLNRATEVAPLNYNLLANPDIGTTAAVSSVAASFGYGRELLTDGDKRVRVMLLRSQSSMPTVGTNSHAQGIFLEAGFMSGRFRHELGAYAAGPNLLFGDYTLAADNRGGYWRVDHTGPRLSWGGGLEYEQQNPKRDPSRIADNRTAISANAQYRLGRDTSIGGNANVSDTRYNNASALALSSNGLRSLNASVFYRTRFYDWGTSSFSATVYSNDALVANAPAATGDQLQWEHDWITGKYETMRPEFSTTLGLAHDRSSGATQTYPTAGVRFRYWADADWSMGGNLNYTSSTGNLSTSRGLSGTLNTERNLGGGWRFGATASLNQAVLTTNSNQSVVNVSGSSFQTPLLSRSNDKSFYVYLRWEGSSGSPYQSAGVRTAGSAGTGRISGTVYFDANRDGEQQVSERGAANVEVFLDGRERVTTDRDGHFEFPVVATGHHQLTLKLESVPLPWGAALDRGLDVDVPLRGQATARIPVVRMGQ